MDNIKFFNIDNESHCKALVQLMLEFHVNGELVDIAENIELTEIQMQNTLGKHVQYLWYAFRDIGVDTSDKVYAWEEKYKYLICAPNVDLELTPEYKDRIMEFYENIGDKPWVDPAGGIHNPDETDPAKQYE